MGAVIEPQYVAAVRRPRDRVPSCRSSTSGPASAVCQALGAGAAVYEEQADRLDALGWPLLDHVIHRTLSQIEPEDKEARFRAFFADLRPGLTHFLCHPAKGGEELDAIVPETCRHRAKEYELFRGPELREYCESPRHQAHRLPRDPRPPPLLRQNHWVSHVARWRRIAKLPGPPDFERECRERSALCRGAPGGVPPASALLS